MRFEIETSLFSPSALAKRFSSIDTQFNITLGKISAIISDSDIEEYQDGGITMNSRLSSVIQDIDGIHGQFSQLNTKYDEVAGEYTSMDSKVTMIDASVNGLSADMTQVKATSSHNETNITNLSADVNSVSSNVTSLKTTVENNYAKKTYADNVANIAQEEAIRIAGDDATEKSNNALSDAKADTDEKLKSYSTTSEMHSAINQSADSIKLDVSKSYVTNTTFSDTMSDYLTAEDVRSAISVESDNITQSVSSTYATKSDLTNLSTRMNEAESKITPDSIVNTVTQANIYTSSYTGSAVPTNSNYPASSWTTDALKEQHIDDVYMKSSGEIYQYGKGKYGLLITFSSYSHTENSSDDYVNIYYMVDGSYRKSPNIGGISIGGKTVFVPSNEFWVYWTSDNSANYYGFEIASIQHVLYDDEGTYTTTSSLPSVTVTTTSNYKDIKTNHPYSASETKMWKYSITYSDAGKESFGWLVRNDAGKTQSQITQTAQGLELKVSSSEYTGNNIVSKINSTTVKIDDKNLNIDTSKLSLNIANSIRLKTSALSWSATNSSLSSDGTFSTINSSDGRMTKITGGRINFYRHSNNSDLLTGFIGPFYWGNVKDSAHEGVTLLVENNSKYLGIGKEVSSNTYISNIVINNGINPGGRTEDIYFEGTSYFKGTVGFNNSGSLSFEVSATSGKSYGQITFSSPFSKAPIVILTVVQDNYAEVHASVSNLTSSRFYIRLKNGSSFTAKGTINWIAFASK